MILPGLAIMGGRIGIDISPLGDWEGDSLDMISGRGEGQYLDNQFFPQETTTIIFNCSLVMIEEGTGNIQHNEEERVE
jgi:hypothetical protein